ncbi:hypothetical protein BBK14_14035 [Parafrankia soli]|uniref:Uncharacterized protein n=1 Tax=Parafrankia soli TaxID=2599596 RepID=A0A1S1QX65_9ACTN|nr:hypothetical protein BBK14_14035 [Parafrankia soli]
MRLGSGEPAVTVSGGGCPRIWARRRGLAEAFPVPVHGLLQGRPQVRALDGAEQRVHGVRAGARVADVPGARRAVRHVQPAAEDVLEVGDQRQQVGARPERQVHRPGVGQPAAGRVGQQPGDRLDVGEVPGLPAVAVHRQRTSTQRGVDERRHDGGVGAPGRLVRAVDVEQPRDQDRQPEARLVRQGVPLGRQRAGRVRAGRTRRVVLGLGAAAGRPVHQSGGDDHHVGLAPLRHVEHGQCAGRIDVVGGQRVEQRALDGGPRSQVDDAVRPGAGVLQQLTVGDAAEDEARGQAEQVRPGSGAEVVDHDHLTAMGQQRTGQVGTDEPGAPGHHDPHRPNHSP